MIKISMVSTARTRGGAARMAALLARSLCSNYDDVDVDFFHCEDKMNDPPFHGLKRLASRPTNAFLARLGGSTCAYDFGVANKLIELTRGADVLHLHNIHGYYLNWIPLLQYWKDRPVVWTWHDQWGATGRCGFAIGCDEWMQGCPKCPNMSYYPRAWIDRARQEFRAKTQIYRKMRKLQVISPSQWLGDIAIRRGFSPDKVKVIPNPVDVAAYKRHQKNECRAELGFTNDAFIALFVAADCNDPRKGYEDFAKITSNMAITAIAIGKEPVTRAAHIIHVGQIVDTERLALYYGAADVMVFTSKADNYPNTVIECLLCGTPIIAYFVGGLASQLDVDFCELVSLGHVEDARDRLSAMVLDKGKTENVAVTLTEYAKNKWADNIIAARYREVYINALQLG